MRILYVSMVTATSLLLAAPEALPMDWNVQDGWLSVTGADGAVFLGPGDGLPLQIRVDDAEAIPPGSAPQVRDSGDGYEAVYELENGVALDRYLPFPALGASAWLREIEYRNVSSDTQDLLSVRMAIAPRVQEDGAEWRPGPFWMREGANGTAVCLSYKGTTDRYRLQTDLRGQPFHQVEAQWRLEPGQTASVAAQGIWLGVAGAEAFRAEARRWYDAIGLDAPPPPAWVYGAILYEYCAGGHIDSRFSDGGGFLNLARQTRYLKELGVNAVWLQAVHQHKIPPDPMRGGWNHYDPRDFSKVDPILGGAEDLRELTDTLHRAGIRLIGEIVPHGGHSVQGEAMKEWWSYERDGTPRKNWGGCGMDYSSPPWQDAMAEAVRWLASDYGMEGVRVDVADGMGPNWESPRTNHASFSTLAGSVEMLRAIKGGLVAGGADHPVVIPENANTIEHFRVSAIGYDHPTWMLLAREIPRLIHDPAGMRKRLVAHFERERGSYPPGAVLLRTLGNHDSVCEAGRVDYRYGVGLARALYGVMLMVPGLPMMYQEDEQGSYEALRLMNLARRRIPLFGRGEPDYVAVDFDPRVFSVLSAGSSAARAVGLSNLSGEEVTGRVRLPATPDGVVAVEAISGREAVCADGGFAWTLAPYETALFSLGGDNTAAAQVAPSLATGGRRGEPLPTESLRLSLHDGAPAVSAGAATLELRLGPGPWELTPAEGGGAKAVSPQGRVTVDAAGERVTAQARFDGGEGEHTANVLVSGGAHWPRGSAWLVSGRTALLEDRVLRRTYPFPDGVDYAWDRSMCWGPVPAHELYDHVSPSGRLWQSVLEPLHPERPAAAFAVDGGLAVILDDISTNAGNVVLTDRTDEMPEAPYRLALRFYEADPDLAPKVRRFGLGQPWTLEGDAEATPQPLEVSFEVTVASIDEARARLKAKRLPVDRGEARRTVAPGPAHEHEGRLFLPDPGTVTWSNLAPVSGRCRIGLTLRHSETGPGGRDMTGAYEMNIDGNNVALDWVEFGVNQTGNAYFGRVLTEELRLDAPQRISVTTKQPWCALRERFTLIPVE